MRILKNDDKEFHAEKICRYANSIIGYSNEKKVFEIYGITDFSNFSLVDGLEFDILNIN